MSYDDLERRIIHLEDKVWWFDIIFWFFIVGGIGGIIVFIIEDIWNWISRF